MAKTKTDDVQAAVEEMVAEVEAMDTEIRTVDPRSLALLKTNARYMRHEQYQQLVSNIKRDGRLTSVPLVAPVDGDPAVLEVLSGNHRTQAAIDAGLPEIPVMVILSPLTKDQRVALQLSHNAIAGQDDPAILKALYESLDDIDWRLYAGLDDKTLGLLDAVQPGSLTEVNLEFTSLSIMFLPEELDRVKEVAFHAMQSVTADTTWVARFGAHDRLLEAFANISQSYGVTNMATVMDLFLDVYERHEDEVVEGWWDAGSDTTKHSKHVPLKPVVGVSAPADAAAVIKKAIERAQRGDTSIPAWKVLEQICGEYLASE